MESKVHCRIHNSPLLIPTLKQITPSHPTALRSTYVKDSQSVSPLYDLQLYISVHDSLLQMSDRC
jgi:hypothetical protein